MAWSGVLKTQGDRERGQAAPQYSTPPPEFREEWPQVTKAPSLLQVPPPRGCHCWGLGARSRTVQEDAIPQLVCTHAHLHPHLHPRA